jgi:hypothetical protein
MRAAVIVHSDRALSSPVTLLGILLSQRVRFNGTFK